MELESVAPEGLVAECVEAEDVPALPQEVVDHPRAKGTGFRRARDLVLDLVARTPDSPGHGAVAFGIALELMAVDANHIVGGAPGGRADASRTRDRRRDKKTGRDC